MTKHLRIILALSVIAAQVVFFQNCGLSGRMNGKSVSSSVSSSPVLSPEVDADDLEGVSLVHLVGNSESPRFTPENSDEETPFPSVTAPAISGEPPPPAETAASPSTVPASTPEVRAPAATTTISTASPSSASLYRIFYVSPKVGSDSNSGESESAPFRTLERAKQAVSSVNAGMTGPIEVRLLTGRYELSSPLTFTPEDAGRNGFKIHYRVATGHRAVISGGIRVNMKDLEWREHRPGVFVANIGANRPIRQVYLKSRKLKRSRGPIHKEKFQITETGLKSSQLASMGSWHLPSDAEAVATFAWKMFRCRLHHVSGDDVHFQPDCIQTAQKEGGVQLVPANSSHVDSWWFENAPELIDETEEWAYLPSTGEFFIKPVDRVQVSRESPDTLTFPVTESLIQIQGKADAPVGGLSFENLEFAHSAWSGPSADRGYAPVQAGLHRNQKGDRVFVPAAVQLRYAQGIRLQGNRFFHLGGGGIAVLEGSKNTSIQKNIFEGLAGGAIHVGEIQTQMINMPESILPPAAPWTPMEIRVQKTLIESNSIARTGQDYLDNVGIFVGFTEETRILNNTLHDLPYTGISVGYKWHPMETLSRDHLISGNSMYNLMQWLTDGGAVYTLGYHRNLVIRDNQIRDIAMELNRVAAGLQFSCGVYLDNGTRGVSVEKNQIANILHNLDNPALGKWNQFVKLSTVGLDSLGLPIPGKPLSDKDAFGDILPDNVYFNWSGLESLTGNRGTLAPDREVIRAFREVIGRDPTPSEAMALSEPLYQQSTSLTRIRRQLADSDEAKSKLLALAPAFAEKGITPSDDGVMPILRDLLFNGASISSIVTAYEAFKSMPYFEAPQASLRVNGGAEYRGPAEANLDFSWASEQGVVGEIRQSVFDGGGCKRNLVKKVIWGGFDQNLNGSLVKSYDASWSKCHVAVCYVVKNRSGQSQPCVSLYFD